MAERGFAVVTLLGNLSKSRRGDKVSSVSFETPTNLKQIVSKLNSIYGVEVVLEEILILVNGVEANVLEGDETGINGGDEIALLPIYHGG